jgi:hypothetical protein
MDRGIPYLNSINGLYHVELSLHKGEVGDEKYKRPRIQGL